MPLRTMKCVLSLLTIVTTLLLSLTIPIGIGCCSFSQNEFLNLMRMDPYFEFHPCYIQWKANQDPKMLLKLREELDNAIASENWQREETKRKEIESEDRGKSGAVENSKITTRMTLIIVIIGGIIGIFCCAALISFVQKKLKKKLQSTTNTLRINYNPDGFNATSTRSAVNINRTTSNFNSTTNANNNINLIGREDLTSSIRGSNVPLLAQVVINRQTSLPSYDDAIKIPTAPSEE